jgi:RHS repeat-associated protein
MSVYKHEATGGTPPISFAQIERNIYGSSRIGSNKTNKELIGAFASTNLTHVIGNKQYDGVNHLGNVLVSFTDKRLPVDADNNSVVDAYWPEVVSANDYYPFGVKMKERSFASSNNRYQFNNKQYDDETETSDFGARNLDGDLGLWGTLDPLAYKYPELSPYAYVGNNTISNSDPDGKAIKPVNKDAELLLKATFDYFGGEKFAAALRLTERNGVVRSNLINMDAATMNIKEFKKTLKDNDIKLSKQDLADAYNLYTTLQSGKKTELAVFSKEQPGTTKDPGQSGTKLVEGEGKSTNENYNKFSEKFEKNNSAIDEVTNGKKFGTLEYKAQNANDPDVSHNGTLIIDATGEKPKETVKTLIQAVKPNQ